MAADSLFELQIAKFVEKAGKNADEVVRKTAFEVFSQVIIISPVDEGRFKGNWQVAIESIPSGVLDTVDKSGTATIAKAKAATLTMRAGQIIYMVNNLEYARPLEYGHSKQAPSGMVRITVENFNAIINRAASEVPK